MYLYVIHRWLGPHAAAANVKNINVCWHRHATLFKLLLLFCRRTKPNRKTAILIQTTSRSGGRISDRTKLFLPRAQEKVACAAAKISDFYLTILTVAQATFHHHAVGPGSGPSTSVCFTFLLLRWCSLVNPLHCV